MNDLTKAGIKTAATKDLVEFYNANSGRDPIKKFATRAIAEHRVAELLDALQLADKPKRKTKTKTTTSDDPRDSHTRRAEAISKSWLHPATAAARSARNATKVGGVVYDSVPKAFVALGLDMKKHQRVRRQMVINGQTTFEGHRFTLVSGE